MKSIAGKIYIVIIMGVLVLGGCAKKSEGPPVSSDYYPKCYEPLDYLRHRGGLGRSIAGGAVQGGFISGLSAIIIGALFGRIDPGRVGVSLGAGAVLGGTAGGLSHASNNKEDTRQMAAYLEEIDGDISDINNVEKAAATLASQCYGKEFKKLAASVKEGTITKSAAEERFSEIISGMTEADKYLPKNTSLEEMTREFSQLK